MKKGPLEGVTVVHLAAWGPGPYASMLMADLGCEVTIVDRRSAMITTVPPEQDPRRRSQKSIALDLKNSVDKEQFLKLLQQADVFIEGMRPGAAERLGIGPDICLQKNPRLIYSRMTGWGQEGSMANTAGHDINYIALSGVLDAIGEKDKAPAIPLNLLGDYGGGGLYLVTGILAALYEREQSGLGQVVDAAIIDGVASLSTATLGMRAVGRWGERGTNTFDGSCPWYTVYATSDGQYVAVGAIEETFYREMLEKLEMDVAQWDRSQPNIEERLRTELEHRFAAKTRNQWEKIFAHSDACVTPILTFAEALQAEHHLSRDTYIDVAGISQPAPGPRLSRTPLSKPVPPPAPGEHEAELIKRFHLFEDIDGND